MSLQWKNPHTVTLIMSLNFVSLLSFLFVTSWIVPTPGELDYYVASSSISLKTLGIPPPCFRFKEFARA